jgi:hypothetical protein
VGDRDGEQAKLWENVTDRYVVCHHDEARFSPQEKQPRQPKKLKMLTINCFGNRSISNQKTKLETWIHWQQKELCLISSSIAGNGV